MEEEPSDILVKQEIPFDLPLVGSLLTELRSLLMDQLEDYSQPVEVPEVVVSGLDDITSGLTLLRDYVLSQSYNVVKVGNGVGKGLLEAEVRQCRERISELEREAREERETKEEVEQQLEVRVCVCMCVCVCVRVYVHAC